MSEQRPLPAVTPETEPYWAAARDHRLVLPRCLACGKTHLYPRALCPFCASDRLDWVEASGEGTVFSFTIVHRAPSPAFEAELPYAVAIVALAEGPHMMTRIIGCDPNEIRIGLPVAVRFQDLDDRISLPVFAVRPQA